MLYLFTGDHYLVNKKRYIWNKWAGTLHRWGMQEVAATLLEASGPLNFVGAQAVYLGQPLLNFMFPEDQIAAIADLLDNPIETEAFTNYLRQQPGSN